MEMDVKQLPFLGRSIPLLLLFHAAVVSRDRYCPLGVVGESEIDGETEGGWRRLPKSFLPTVQLIDLPPKSLVKRNCGSPLLIMI